MNKKNIKSFFYRVIRITLIVYILFGGFLYFFQGDILYHPSQVSFYDCPELEDYDMVSYNNTRFYKLSQGSDGVLIHYHGNAGRACDRAFKHSILESSGRDIILVEYSGFAGDTQKPSKKLLEANVQDIQNYIDDIGYSDIAVYGESLGSGLGTYHASIGKVNQMILVNPFSSVQDIAIQQYPIYPSFLLTQNYDNIYNLRDYTGNISILHGQEDALISPDLSYKLHNSLTGSQDKTYTLYKGYGHNDIWYSVGFQEDFKNIIQIQ